MELLDIIEAFKMYRGYSSVALQELFEIDTTRMWANAQRDGRPAEHRWRPLFNAAKFG